MTPPPEHIGARQPRCAASMCPAAAPPLSSTANLNKQVDMADVAMYYERVDPFDDDLFLTMIANEWHPRRQISCCLLGDGDPSKPENYLLLLPLVERAYLAHEACILPDSDGRLKFHVLNPALLPLTLAPSQKTFAALDGGHVHHPVDRSPNRDMLIEHATVALDMAVKRGLLSKSAADALRSGSL